jgi:hypothetical protein
MIESIRKYQGLIILFIVLVVISLVVGLRDDMFSGSTGQALFRINGRTYSDRDFNQLGTGGLELTSALAQSGDYSLFPFLIGLTKGATNNDDRAFKFFENRMVIRDEAHKLGIYPGDPEIDEYIRSHRAFQNQEQKFDAEAYQNFVSRYLGRLGLTENDLRILASDILSHRKISELVGKGFTPNREVITRNFALENQQITGQLAKLDIDPFEAEIKPTDDEIKAYWEVIQDAFQTEPRRKFSYVIVTPEAVPDPEPEKESIADATATEEQKKKKAEEKAKRDAELADLRRKKQLEADKLVDDFVFELEEAKGEGFEKLAKENGWDFKTSELFSLSGAPAELTANLRSSSRGGRAVDELFRMVPTSDPVSKLSQPLAIGTNQWLVAKLEEEEAARAKTWDEAKEEARAQFISEKAGEAMKQAATEAAEKLKTALTAGKSFADAAKEAGLGEAREFSKITQTYQPDAANEPRNLFEVTRYVDPGTLAEPVIEADRVFLIHVAAREIVKEENLTARIDSAVTQAANQNETLAFDSWLDSKVKAAKIEELFRK